MWITASKDLLGLIGCGLGLPAHLSFNIGSVSETAFPCCFRSSEESIEEFPYSYYSGLLLRNLN